MRPGSGMIHSENGTFQLNAPQILQVLQHIGLRYTM